MTRQQDVLLPAVAVDGDGRLGGQAPVADQPPQVVGEVRVPLLRSVG